MEKFTYGRLERGRKIVVDLLTMIAPAAIPSYLIRDIDMSWANQFKKNLDERGIKVTVTAILLKAIATAQKLHPASRSDVLPFGRIATYEDIVGGFTIERNVGGKDTVFFGEIESPHEKSICDIALELTKYARSKPSDLPPLALQSLYSGFPYLLRKLIMMIALIAPSLRLKCQKATFGLTTLGKYNVKAVLSPCICTSTFGIGTIEERAVPLDGKVCVRPIMTISFNFNAKVMDMATASAFLEDVCNLMEGRSVDWLSPDDTMRAHQRTPVRLLAEMTA